MLGLLLAPHLLPSTLDCPAAGSSITAVLTQLLPRLSSCQLTTLLHTSCPARRDLQPLLVAGVPDHPGPQLTHRHRHQSGEISNFSTHVNNYQLLTAAVAPWLPCLLARTTCSPLPALELLAPVFPVELMRGSFPWKSACSSFTLRRLSGTPGLQISTLLPIFLTGKITQQRCQSA